VFAAIFGLVGSSSWGHRALPDERDEVMVRAKIFGLAGAAFLLSNAALAADLPPPLPPPMYQPPPPVACCTTGWYLRGDVGVGMQRFNDFEHHQTNAAFVWPASWTIAQKDAGDTAFVGFGIGYAWNNWLRFDVTGEYRKKSNFKVVGQFSGFADFCPPDPFFGPAQTCSDVYEFKHNAWVVMANAYVDLGTWWCFTPFIGAGIGAARHEITGLTDVGYGFGFATLGTANGGNLTTTTDTKWTAAWALHAGIAYNVSNNVKIEFAYRYLNFGSIDTPVINCGPFGCASSGPRAFYTLTNLTSNDFRVGLRVMLQQDTPAPPPAFAPPLMRKG
jgi:opacity protein-like surface antigen